MMTVPFGNVLDFDHERDVGTLSREGTGSVAILHSPVPLIGGDLTDSMPVSQYGRLYRPRSDLLHFVGVFFHAILIRRDRLVRLYLWRLP
jgi:hypothetical protein